MNKNVFKVIHIMPQVGRTGYLVARKVDTSKPLTLFNAELASDWTQVREKAQELCDELNRLIEKHDNFFIGRFPTEEEAFKK